MKEWLRWIIVVCLMMVYTLVLLAIFRPRTSREYRSYYVHRTSVDWNPPHYRATPEEGMIFNKPGLPDWVAWVYGFAATEPAGRWTDNDLGNVAGLVFDRAFSGTVCVEFSAAPAPHMSRSFGLILGGQSKTVSLKAPGLADYQVRFDHLEDASELEFVLPKNLLRVRDYEANNGDRRRLGLLFKMVRIRSVDCTSTH